MRWPWPVVLAALAVGCATTPAPPRPLLSAQEHNDLGVAYQARGEIELALREYRRALAQDLAFVRAWVNLGNAEAERGRTEEAVVAYERALTLAPSDPEVLNNLAWALHHDPRALDRAEELIRRALARDPEPRYFYLDTLGAILLKRGSVAAASAALEEGLSRAPQGEARGRAALLYHLGLVRRAQGNPEGAIRFFREALALDPAGPFGAKAREAMEPPAVK